MNESAKRSLLEAVFNAMPSIVFLVDADVRIQEYNQAAAELMMTKRMVALKQRAGDILHCVHSLEVAEGCGNAPFCKDCVIRNSVVEAFQGNRIVRRRAKLELTRDRQTTLIYALITVSPFVFQETPLALLVIEDISEIAELHRLIPICASCRKVRDDKESWIRVETYFKENWDVDFTHGLCPACLQTEMDKVDALIKGERSG